MLPFTWYSASLQDMTFLEKIHRIYRKILTIMFGHTIIDIMHNVLGIAKK